MKVLAVIVRYQMALSESPTLQGLCDAFSSQPDFARAYTVMIWDNSPEAIVNPQLSIPFLYQHSKVNLGVSGAYNGAMEYALEHGYPWMLLLDQDTKITNEFLFTMFRHSQDLLPRQEIAAIAPTVRAGRLVISPTQRLFCLRGRPRKYLAGECGIAPGEAAPINSGCIMRVASLRAIGGFSTDFWLDCSDIYVFHEFFVHGLKVWRAADVEIEHNISVIDYDRLMTPWRYRNLSYAETAFYDLHKGRIESAVQTLQLFARAIKLRIKYDNPEFSRITWEQLMYRLRVSQTERIARWHTECKKRAVRQPDRTGEIGRPVLQ
jgi:GT2 family glycosyltransferase